jgi:hypothetical protein
MRKRQDSWNHLGPYLNCLKSVTLDVGRGGKDIRFGVKSLSLTLESTGNRAFQSARKNEDRIKLVPGNGNEVKLNREPCLNLAWRKWQVNPIVA